MTTRRRDRFAWGDDSIPFLEVTPPEPAPAAPEPIKSTPRRNPRRATKKIKPAQE